MQNIKSYKSAGSCLRENLENYPSFHAPDIRLSPSFTFKLVEIILAERNIRVLISEVVITSIIIIVILSIITDVILTAIVFLTIRLLIILSLI